jgi:hypothetical protein
MLDSFIEDRYSKRSRPIFHSSAFAITAGVVGVAAAGAGAAVSISSADRAAKAQARAGRAYERRLKKSGSKYERSVRKFNRQQKKLKKRVQAIDPTINIPQYDLRGATLEGIETANQITANTLQQLEKVAPGSTEARQQVGSIIESYLRAEVPQDVQEQTMRMIAERGGAGFNIATAGRGMGPQAPQADLARSLGLTSLQLQQTGINAAQSWQQLAGQFIQSPTQMMALSLQGRGQDITVAQANIANKFRQLGMIGDINAQQLGAMRELYGMEAGQAQTGYQVGQQNIASNLAAQQAIGQGIQSVGSAASGALMGVGAAYGQQAAAQAAAPVPTQTVAGYQGQTYMPAQTSTGAEFYTLAPKAYQ